MGKSTGTSQHVVHYCIGMCFPNVYMHFFLNIYVIKTHMQTHTNSCHFNFSTKWFKSCNIALQ